MSRIWLAIVIVLGIGSSELPAGEVAQGRDGEGVHKRLVVRLASVPAADTAGTLQQLFQAEGQAAPSATARNVVIVAERLSNSLILAGPPEAVEEVRQLALQLDHVTVIVRLEVLIAEAPAAELKSSAPEGKPAPGTVAEQVRLLEKPEKMEILSRATLTTLSDQQAHLQIGRKESQITGTTTSSGGRTQSTMGYQNEGTTIKITPRVGPDKRLTLLVDVQDTRLGPAEEAVVISAPKEGEPTRARSTEDFHLKTTLSVADGQTMVLGGVARQPHPGTERLLLVTPHLHYLGDAAASGK